MIQEITPKNYDNTYRPQPPQPEDILLCYDGRRILAEKDGDKIRFPAVSESEAQGNTHLFSIDDGRYYLGSKAQADQLLQKGYQWEDTRILLGGQELALAEWMRREEIQVEPEDLSLTNEMMVFKNGERV